MSLLLLGLSLIGALYTVKTKLLDIRIANSELRKNQAVISAEAGLQRGIAQLYVLPTNTDSIVDEVVGNNQYTVDFIVMDDGTGQNLGHPNWENDRIVTITSTGVSDDGSGTKVMEQKAWVHPVLRSEPDSAMTVDGAINVGGNFNIGAAPNGGGLGVPLSVWSSSPSLQISGSGETCGLEEFDNEECATYSYSDSTNPGADLYSDTLVSAGGTFPDDLFEHTFGVPRSEYQSIKDEAEELLSDCSTLDTNSVGLIWVTGFCDTPGDIGSREAPVVLVIENAGLKMNANDDFYGVIYTFDAADSGATANITLNGGASVFGAFISDYDTGTVNGTYNLRFDPQVLANIVNGNNEQFMKIELIPGSWKDF